MAVFPVVITIHNVTRKVHCRGRPIVSLLQSIETGIFVQNVVFVSQAVQPLAAPNTFRSDPFVKPQKGHHLGVKIPLVSVRPLPVELAQVIQPNSRFGVTNQTKERPLRERERERDNQRERETTTARERQPKRERETTKEKDNHRERQPKRKRQPKMRDEMRDDLSGVIPLSIRVTAIPRAYYTHSL